MNKKNYVTIYSIVPKIFMNNIVLNSTDKLLILHTTTLCNKKMYITLANNVWNKANRDMKNTYDAGVKYGLSYNNNYENNNNSNSILDDETQKFLDYNWLDVPDDWFHWDEKDNK